MMNKIVGLPVKIAPGWTAVTMMFDPSASSLRCSSLDQRRSKSFETPDGRVR